MIPKRQWEEVASPADPPSASTRPAVSAWGGEEAYVASPARELQVRLERAYAPAEGFPEPEVEPWPAAWRLGALAGAVVVSWSLVLGGVWMGAGAVRWAQGGQAAKAVAAPTRSGRLAPL